MMLRFWCYDDNRTNNKIQNFHISYGEFMDTKGTENRKIEQELKIRNQTLCAHKKCLFVEKVSLNLTDKQQEKLLLYIFSFSCLQFTQKAMAYAMQALLVRALWFYGYNRNRNWP